MARKICGVGINDSDYVTRRFDNKTGKLVMFCPYFRRWQSMIYRCYSKKVHKVRPSYTGCSVSTEWLTFSTFKLWMADQDWEGNHLDKDILFPGNKVYSPDTCLFVSPMVNTFTLDGGHSGKSKLLGFSLDKRTGRYGAVCRNPFTGSPDYLGYYGTPDEAHEAWKSKKREHATLLANKQIDKRVADALRRIYA